MPASFRSASPRGGRNDGRLSATARAQARLDEKDPQAVALNYVHDATRVDPKKQLKYAAGQVCSNCPLFGTRQVAGKGWCTAWARKG